MEATSGCPSRLRKSRRPFLGAEPSSIEYRRNPGAFAWIDSTGKQTPIYDPPPPTRDGFSESQLFGATFFAATGSSLSLDAAFLTSDGGPFADYGIIALVPAPEPSSLVLVAMAAIGLAGYALRKRNRASRAS